MAVSFLRGTRLIVFLLLLYLHPVLPVSHKNRLKPRRARTKFTPKVQPAPRPPPLPLSEPRIKVGDHCPSWGIDVSEPTKRISAISKIDITGEGQRRAIQLERTCFTIRAIDAEGVNASFDKGCQQRAFFRILISTPHPPWLPKGAIDPTGIRLSGVVSYVPSTSSHEACYTIASPGTYVALLLLDFTNVFVLTSRNPQCCNPDRGRQRNLVKANLTITVHPAPEPPLEWPREKLPRCSFPLLTASRNQGHWKGNQWEPSRCQTRQLEPAEIVECLRGKSLVMVGDSQIRYIAAELMALVAARSRSTYVQKWGGKLKAATSIRQKHSSASWQKTGPSHHRDMIAVTRFGPNMSFHFYGSYWGGGRHPLFADCSFNLTYVAHMDAKSPVVADWMVDQSMMERHVATRFAPFDLMLTSTGLHDVSSVPIDLFETNLKRNFVPGILELVPQREGITVTSIQASEDIKKRVKHVARSNNPRAVVYENILERVTQEEGITNWLNLREMTISRLDMCTDSTHYGWAMSLALIDLWLGSVCAEASTSL